MGGERQDNKMRTVELDQNREAAFICRPSSCCTYYSHGVTAVNRLRGRENTKYTTHATKCTVLVVLIVVTEESATQALFSAKGELLSRLRSNCHEVRTRCYSGYCARMPGHLTHRGVFHHHIQHATFELSLFPNPCSSSSRIQEPFLPTQVRQ